RSQIITPYFHTSPTRLSAYLSNLTFPSDSTALALQITQSPNHVSVFSVLQRQKKSPGHNGRASAVAEAWSSEPMPGRYGRAIFRSEEHTSELQSHLNLRCRLL